MSLGMNVIPELWSSEIVQQLETSTPMINLSNKMIASALASKGDKMYITGAADVTSGAYSDTADITYATPTDTSTTLTLNQDYAVALELRDSEIKQASVNWQQIYAKRMGYKLALDLESYIGSLHASFGLDSYETGTTAWQLGTAGADVPVLFAAITKQLADADAFALPGRPYMVLPTIGIQAIQLYLSGKATNLGDMVMVEGMKGKAGYMGTLGGFDIFSSTQLTTVSTTVHGIAGISGDGIAVARAIEPTVEAIRLEGGFKTGIRARHLFGAAVYRSGIMVDINLNTTLLA